MDKAHNHYALGDAGNLLTVIREMIGVPNDWIEKDGTFTHVFETDQMKQAMSAIRELVQAGVFHPDTFTSTTVQRKTWFAGGIIAMNYDAYSTWTAYATDPGAVSHGAKISALVPPGYSGGPGTHRPGSTSFSLVAFKKADKGRLQELLAIANWLAIPYGTQEYLFRKYGVEGVDYAMKDGNPTLTDQGTRETVVATYFITDAPPILGPGQKGLVQAQHDFQTQVVPLIVSNPTVGLYSDTDSRIGTKINESVNNFRNDYLQGRKDLSGWPDIVKKWREGGGDKIRTEYEQAYTAVH